MKKECPICHTLTEESQMYTYKHLRTCYRCYNERKPCIYVLSPSNVATGGTEALAQLADKLTEMGANCKMIYMNEGVKPKEFDCYKYDYDYTYSVKKDDLVIIPEIWAELAIIYPCNVAIWWLGTLCYQGSFDIFKVKNIMHLYQSYHAKEYLERNGIAEAYYLTDYVNKEYLNSIQDVARNDNILYNPVRCKNEVEEIKKLPQMQKYNFISITGMTRKEIIDLMVNSKLYLDCGMCWGKDRLPREAIACGMKLVLEHKGGFKNASDWKNNFSYTYPKEAIADAIVNAMESDTGMPEETKASMMLEYVMFNDAVQYLFKKYI